MRAFKSLVSLVTLVLVLNSFIGVDVKEEKIVNITTNMEQWR